MNDERNESFRHVEGCFSGSTSDRSLLLRPNRVENSAAGRVSQFDTCKFASLKEKESKHLRVVKCDAVEKKVVSLRFEEKKVQTYKIFSERSFMFSERSFVALDGFIPSKKRTFIEAEAVTAARSVLRSSV